MTMHEANGARIPPIGLGTMTLQDAVCVEAVKTALRLGYRHLDTAERYGNEAAVGEDAAGGGMPASRPPPDRLRASPSSVSQASLAGCGWN